MAMLMAMCWKRPLPVPITIPSTIGRAAVGLAGYEPDAGENESVDGLGRAVATGEAMRGRVNRGGCMWSSPVRASSRRRQRLYHAGSRHDDSGRDSDRVAGPRRPGAGLDGLRGHCGRRSKSPMLDVGSTVVPGHRVLRHHDVECAPRRARDAQLIECSANPRHEVTEPGQIRRLILKQSKTLGPGECEASIIPRAS
jgi:hypothetical protein